MKITIDIEDLNKTILTLQEEMFQVYNDREDVMCIFCGGVNYIHSSDCKGNELLNELSKWVKD